MDIHKLLKRQLEKTHLNADEKPESTTLWLEFLARVNQSYIETDQERYLQERSMDISSREMMTLNAMLEEAQHIAKLGYWTYDGITDHTTWSKELYSLFNLNSAHKPPNYKEFIALAYESDRYELEEKVENALNNRVNYDCEIRIKNASGIYRWYKIIAQCGQKERQLAGILLDIHDNKTAEEEIKALHQQLLQTARRAGMAQVATAILHNIGNVLNSANVSISLLKNYFVQPYLQKFFKVNEMLSQHENDLADFLTKDIKGQVIPKYLSALSNIFLDDHQKNSIEVDNLVQNLQHIKDIVATQKSIGGVSSMNEKVYLPEVIELALNMSIILPNDEVIKITRVFEKCPLIDTDKSKLLQILVNLIQNAKDATLQNKHLDSEIQVHIKKFKENAIQIIIIDDGIGIESSDLSRIFAFGYTTKENGHGFGLHSSALSAQDMGGSLQAQSLGIGHGATFILTLPIKYALDIKGDFNE